MVISSKVKGIFRVSASNILSLALSMVTSFVLPLFISVEEYGYWQLFVLYNSYVGFFVLGFNDGVHLNFATYDYDRKLIRIFGAFKNFLLFLTIIETIFLLVFCKFFICGNIDEYYIIFLAVLNLIPTALNGLFLYMNQATMRFKYYAISCIVDKVLFSIVLVFLIICNVQNVLIYIVAFTLCRYLVIGYNYLTSYEVFAFKPYAISKIKKIILSNFINGFPLMLAVILGNSIIVGSRLLVKSQFGISTFGAFSFSIHTIVIASQFIAAIASVFYPILKRYPMDNLAGAYTILDKSTSILSALLLLSYYPIAMIILLLYTKYAGVLEYLTFVYPLFVFQCKASILITNIYKVRNKIMSLIVANVAAIIIHLVFVFMAYYIYGSVTSIAIAVLISYGIWYYIFQYRVFYKEGWKTKFAVPVDAMIIAVFILVNIVVNYFIDNNSMIEYILAFIVYMSILGVIIIIFKNQIKKSLKDVNELLKD